MDIKEAICHKPQRFNRSEAYDYGSSTAAGLMISGPPRSLLSLGGMSELIS